MKKQEMLQKIKEKVDNINDERKKKVIATIVNKDGWYNEVNYNTFTSILFDLGYDKEEIKNIYIEII